MNAEDLNSMIDLTRSLMREKQASRKRKVLVRSFISLILA